MIGDIGEKVEDLQTNRGSNNLTEEEFEVADNLLTYYEMQRGIEYGREKRSGYIRKLGKFLRAMKELDIDPINYINWVLSEYEPAYINMLLSKNNLKRYASTTLTQSNDGYYFDTSKTAVRIRRNYGMSDLAIYKEIKDISDSLVVYMHTQKGGLDRDELEDFDELKYRARVQWQVLSDAAKEDLLEFFSMDELNF